ncbi:hypothetical protein FA95DRAFT_1559206 [Auriscalpium vulgare]|uniref:Uncharacterized protein n=1 Tax=Auriscalpium vulgare TaxID=40419 RepID=A0ACB8RT75_9AGAM|nr:hypothetical protein FA95DRAFT_1559206 [Auriscalpium vulgare]
MSSVLCSPERFLRWSPPQFTGSWQPKSALSFSDANTVGHATLSDGGPLGTSYHRFSGDAWLLGLIVSLRKHRKERIFTLPLHSDDVQEQISYPTYIHAEFVQPVIDVFNAFREIQNERHVCWEFRDQIDTSPPYVAANIFLEKGHYTPLYSGMEARPSPPVMECVFIGPGAVDISKFGRTEGRQSDSDEALQFIEGEVLRLLTTSASYVLVTDTMRSTLVTIRKRRFINEPLPDPLVLEFIEVIDHRASGSTSLRFFIAACIFQGLAKNSFSRTWINPRNLAQGARNNPSLPLPSDEEVMRTRKRFSDFDLYSLQNDVGQAQQFFRWKPSHGTASFNPGDVMTVDSDASKKHWLPWSDPPRYTLDPLPESTLDYVKSVRRTTPNDPLAILILESKTLAIRITRIIGDFNSRAVVGRLISVDNEPLPTAGELPDLCIKLYDDVLNPEQLWCGEGDDVVRSFSNWYTTESKIAQEDAAYRRLEHVQGSVVPLYYGAHSFQAPSGEVVYGTIMEYVDGVRLDEIGMDGLSTTEQVQLIESARHCVRALQYASITQGDWHPGQILCRRTCPTPDGSAGLACVFVDLASMIMSTKHEVHKLMDDYGGVREALAYVLGEKRHMLDEHYAPREAWDLFNFEVNHLTIPFHDIEAD